MEIWTVGHSTRGAEEFLGLLRRYGIEQVADVRTVPGSRHNPQFNQDALGPFLAAHGIRYERIPELGGFRKVRSGSPNGAWRNKSFQGYADHMQTAEFEAGLRILVQAAEERPTAVMCAEAVPWRCHRSLIADVLVARGFKVVDIISEHDAHPHRMTPFAVVADGKVSYPPTGSQNGDTSRQGRDGQREGGRSGRDVPQSSAAGSRKDLK